MWFSSWLAPSHQGSRSSATAWGRLRCRIARWRSNACSAWAAMVVIWEDLEEFLQKYHETRKTTKTTNPPTNYKLSGVCGAKESLHFLGGGCFGKTHVQTLFQVVISKTLVSWMATTCLHEVLLSRYISMENPNVWLTVLIKQLQSKLD